MSEDIPYTIKIMPLKYAIFKIIPIYQQFEFKYQATNSLIACLLNITTNTCNQKKAKIDLKLTNKGEIVMEKTTEHDYQVKIFNPFTDINIEVTSIFHSLITNHCESKKLGDIYA
jgi:hypothetical protein